MVTLTIWRSEVLKTCMAGGRAPPKNRAIACRTQGSVFSLSAGAVCKDTDMITNHDHARWVRSAFWSGTLREGTQADFVRGMNIELVLTLRALPGVHDARALWPKKRDDSPPPIVCQVLVEFGCRADLDTMLASPERVAMRERMKAYVAMLDGSISHIDYEVAP